MTSGRRPEGMLLACCYNGLAEQEFPLVNVLLAKVPRKGCFHLGFEGFPVSFEDVGESSFGSLLEDCGCLKLDQDRQVWSEISVVSVRQLAEVRSSWEARDMSGEVACASLGRRVGESVLRTPKLELAISVAREVPLGSTMLESQDPSWAFASPRTITERAGAVG